MHAFRRYNYYYGVPGNLVAGVIFLFFHPSLQLDTIDFRERRTTNMRTLTVVRKQIRRKKYVFMRLCPTPNSKRNKEEGEWLGHKRLYRYIFSSRIVLVTCIKLQQPRQQILYLQSTHHSISFIYSIPSQSNQCKDQLKKKKWELWWWIVIGFLFEAVIVDLVFRRIWQGRRQRRLHQWWCYCWLFHLH